MRSTKGGFMELVQPTEDLVLVESYRLKGNDLLNVAGKTAILNYSTALDKVALFFDMRGSKYLSTITFELLFQATVRYVAVGQQR